MMICSYTVALTSTVNQEGVLQQKKFTLALRLKLFRFSSDLIQKVALKHQNSGLSPKFYVLEHTLLSLTLVKMLIPGMKNLEKDPCSEAVKNTKWNNINYIERTWRTFLCHYTYLW